MTPPEGLKAPIETAPDAAATGAGAAHAANGPPRANESANAKENAPAPGPARFGPAFLERRSPFAKYWAILRVSLVERMTYRLDFLIGTLLRFLPTITTILLWKAIYIGAGGAALGDKQINFRYREMIAYLLMTQISRMFSSMPGLAAGIAREVREGTLKRYLLQPIDMVRYLLTYRVAHKIAYIATSFLPYAFLFYICRGYFDGLPDAPTFAAYVLSLVMAFLVGFYFETCVGMVGFWFLEVTSLLWIVMTLNFFISGHMLPIDLLPQPWSGLLKALPFQYMAYFPAVVFLGKVKGAALWLYLLGELFWVVFFMLLARGLYRLGLRRYGAFGG